MIFLKGILYLILCICFFWGIAIYAGSSIIKSASRIAFGDDVKLSNVVVEADLTISVGVLDFDLKSKAESVPIFGKLRAVRMDWSLFSFDPHVKFTVGPSKVDGFFEFEAAEIRLMPIKITSVTNLITRIEINKILLGDGTSLHQLLVNGILDGEKVIFSDVNFELFDLETEKYPKLSTHHLTGTIDRYQLLSNFIDQKNTILMSSNEVIFGPKDESLSSLLSEIQNQHGSINSVTKIGELKGYEDQLSIKDININHIGSDDTMGTSVKIGLSSNNIEYEPYNLNIDDLLVEAEVGHEGFQMDVTGELVELGLSFDGYYLGELGSSDFDVDIISLFSDNHSKINLYGQLISHTDPALKVIWQQRLIYLIKEIFLFVC